MFAASKIYIFVNFSEDDGDYFVIFKSAVGNDKQRKRMKRLKTILVWQNVICVMLLLKRSNQTLFSWIREGGLQSDIQIRVFQPLMKIHTDVYYQSNHNMFLVSNQLLNTN